MDLGSQGTLTIQRLTTPADLAHLTESWEELSRNATDPNVFYSPWNFLPAARHLGACHNWQILLLWRRDRTSGSHPVLSGFFPFVERRHRLLGTNWSLWMHPYCFLTNPLIEQGQESVVWNGVFEYLSHMPRPVSWIDCPLIAGEGALSRGLIEVARERRLTTYTSDEYLRATTAYAGTADELLKQSMAGHHLRELRRLRRKLEGSGQLEYRSLSDSRGADLWLDWFLKLEGSGWKGAAGTSMQQQNSDSQYFQEMVHAGLAQKSVKMEGLFLSGNPVALKVNLLAPPTAFAFKIAFDETLSKFSPGIQLELESLQSFIAHDGIDQADSCAAPGHPMINRIWGGRRVIRHLQIATGRGSGDLKLGLKQCLRGSYRTVRKGIQRFKAGRGSRRTSAAATAVVTAPSAESPPSAQS